MRRLSTAALAAGVAFALSPLPAAHALCAHNHDPDGIHAHSDSCVHTYTAEPGDGGTQRSHAYAGGCGLAGAAETAGDDVDVVSAMLYAAAVVTNPLGAAATVRCEVKVNGVPAGTATFAGAGVVTGAQGVAFVVTDTDTVSLCDTVTVNGHTTSTCQAVARGDVPPAAVDDLLGDPSCVGFPSIPAAYLCVVEVGLDGDGPTVFPGATVTVPPTCWFVCIGPFGQTVPPIHAPAAHAVVYLNGTCYYVNPDGTVTSQPATGPGQCG